MHNLTAQRIRSDRPAPSGGTTALVLAIILGGGAGNVAAQDPSGPAPSVQQLVDWLDNPETEWGATARLQEVRQTALSLLLRPGRVASGPHDRWTAPMLALSKIGEPAIPAIVDRLLTILRTPDSQVIAAAYPLIKVLGSMGPHAVPALVQVAEASQAPFITSDALDEIVRLEPRTTVYGQDLSPWAFWRPADDRLTELLERWNASSCVSLLHLPMFACSAHSRFPPTISPALSRRWRRKRTPQNHGIAIAQQNSCYSSAISEGYPRGSKQWKATRRLRGCSPAATSACTPSWRCRATPRQAWRRVLLSLLRGAPGGTEAAVRSRFAAAKPRSISRYFLSSRRSASEVGRSDKGTRHCDRGPCFS
jgi:hypothetical protein